MRSIEMLAMGTFADVQRQRAHWSSPHARDYRDGILFLIWIVLEFLLRSALSD
jgi:hypothetical protein